MPSPLAHSVSGYILAQFLPLDRPKDSRVKKKWYVQGLYAVFVAICADFDFIPQIITGVNYHRGFTHSIFCNLIFSIIAGFAIGYWGKYSYRQIFLFTAIVYGSHLFLDFFTEGSRGMQLFWPLTENYFKSPISIFPGVHYSRGLWHYSHLIPIGFELAYSALLMTGFFYWQKSPYSQRKNIKKLD